MSVGKAKAIAAPTPQDVGCGSGGSWGLVVAVVTRFGIETLLAHRLSRSMRRAMR